MKRLLASSLMITFFGVTFAVSPDAFQIEVSPSSLSVDGIAKDSASKLKLTDATISNGGILEMGLADQ